MWLRYVNASGQFSCIDNYEATYVSLSKYNYVNAHYAMFLSLQVCHIKTYTVSQNEVSM